MDFSEYCAPGSTCREERVAVSAGVSLRMVKFTPARKGKNPPVVFVPGWISLMRGWQAVLREMTRDFEIIYIETREKISSRVEGKAGFGVKEIGDDIVHLVSRLGLPENGYVLLGSSLGATVILDCFHSLSPKPLCLVLVGPNAVFRVPRLWIAFIHVFYPGFYMLLKPVVKWYLRTFRMDVHADYAQYEKYCSALDAADPWKLKKAVIPFSRYKVWDLLPGIGVPALIYGASKDKLHEPENLKKMVSMLPMAVYVDLETNQGTHSESMVSEMRKYLAGLKSC
jgi:pimeloyl-ACP methyl ester carboxylesterase